MRGCLKIALLGFLALRWSALAKPAESDLRLEKPPPDLSIRRLHREHVESSVFTEIGYHKTTGTLELRFANGGVYRYQRVPRKVWEEFRTAPSKGAYFDTHIRSRYAHWRVDG